MKLLSALLILLFNISYSQTQIYVKQDATGNLDGSSWENAYTDLQNALEISVPGTQIWIAAGTYKPNGFTPADRHFLSVNAIEIYGGFTGTETDLTQRDWQAHRTIISGDIENDDIKGDFLNFRDDNAHHIMIIDAGNALSILDGVIFSGGVTLGLPYAPDANDIPYNRWSGGALYINNSKTVIRNCIFEDNDGLRGSGMFAGGGALTTINLVIENTAFQLNNGYNGAGCFLSGWNSLIVRDNVFLQNNGFQGGALFLSNTNATVEGCTFNNNTTSGYGGACVVFHGNTSLFSRTATQFLRNIFTDNISVQEGGAIFFNNAYADFALEIDSCDFLRNESYFGGAICLDDNKDTNEEEDISQLTISNSTFTQNKAVIGGALEIWGVDNSIQVQVLHSNFFANTSPGGEGGAFEVYIQERAVIDLLLKHDSFENDSSRFGGAGVLVANQNSLSMLYTIDSCSFKNNYAERLGGGIYGSSNYTHNVGTILNTEFINNQGIGTGGGLLSITEKLTIEKSIFSGNYTEGNYIPEYNGGGGATFIGFQGIPEDVTVRNSIFDHNISTQEGSAILTFGKEAMISVFENVLFHDNGESTTIQNGGIMELTNVTFLDNILGFYAKDSSRAEFQNTVLDNHNENLIIVGSAKIMSKGGNFSSDDSMSDYLLGSGGYQDIHNADPLLGVDYLPLSNSLCIDGGNPEGITSKIDLAGNPRITGNTIDIGAFETFTVSSHYIGRNNYNIRFFPNPVNDLLTISSYHLKNPETKIEIHNALGQSIFKQTKISDATDFLTIDVSTWANGIYFIAIRDKSGLIANGQVEVSH